MIWDDSTRFGCAVAENAEENEIFVVVRYGPSLTDKSPENMRNHVKPPTLAIFNETSMTWFK